MTAPTMTAEDRVALDPVKKAKLEKLLAKGPRRGSKRKRKPAKHLSPAQLLLAKAIKVLEKGRWIQGEYADYEGGYCSVGALREASDGVTMGKRSVEVEAINLLGTVVQRRTSPGGPDYDIFRSPDGGTNDVITWNDIEGNTKRRVLRAFREAAGLRD